jgi:hypothetical protein
MFYATIQYYIIKDSKVLYVSKTKTMDLLELLEHIKLIADPENKLTPEDTITHINIHKVEQS